MKYLCAVFFIIALVLVVFALAACKVAKDDRP